MTKTVPGGRGRHQAGAWRPSRLRDAAEGRGLAERDVPVRLAPGRFARPRDVLDDGGFLTTERDALHQVVAATTGGHVDEAVKHLVHARAIRVDAKLGNARRPLGS